MINMAQLMVTIGQANKDLKSGLKFTKPTRSLGNANYVLEKHEI